MDLPKGHLRVPEQLNVLHPFYSTYKDVLSMMDNTSKTHPVNAAATTSRLNGRFERIFKRIVRLWSDSENRGESRREKLLIPKLVTRSRNRNELSVLRQYSLHYVILLLSRELDSRESQDFIAINSFKFFSVFKERLRVVITTWHSDQCKGTLNMLNSSEVHVWEVEELVKNILVNEMITFEGITQIAHYLLISVGELSSLTNPTCTIIVTVTKYH